MSEAQCKQLDEIAERFGETIMANYRKRESESLEGRLLKFVDSHERMKRVHARLARAVAAISPA